MTRSTFLPASSSLALLVLATTACETTEQPEPLSECTLWQPFLDHQVAWQGTPKTLRWHEGVLYYAAQYGPGIQRVSASGGAPSLLVERGGPEFWVEGDRLLFPGPLHSDELHSVPVSGGRSSVMLAPPPGRFGYSMLQALDADSYYWDYHSEHEHHLWSTPRSGGPSRRLAPMPENGTRLALTSAGVLVYTQGSASDAHLVPREGGAGVPVPARGLLLGVDAGELLWGGRPGRPLERTRLADMASEPFWPNRSRFVRPVRAWPDGNGGWVVATREQFDHLHAAERDSIWHLDRDQKAVRLACNPKESSSELTVNAVALAADAVFVGIETTLNNTWSIVKAPRGQ